MHTLHAMFSPVFRSLPQPRNSTGRRKLGLTVAGRVLQLEARRVVQQTQEAVRRAQVQANASRRSIRRELSIVNSSLSYRVASGYWYGKPAIEIPPFRGLVSHLAESLNVGHRIAKPSHRPAHKS
jgi:hypothetical protein